MRNESFLDILAQKLTQEVRAELEAENFTTEIPSASRPLLTPHFVTEHQLLGRMESQVFQRNFSQSRYQAFRTPPRRRPSHKMTAEQLQAWIAFRSWDEDLAENFSQNELRAAFRRLAKRFHPDHGGTAEAFLEIQNAKQVLLSLFP